MAVKYQFNKISMQYLRKQLKVRQTALPTIKSKEAALRLTVKKQKELIKQLKADFDNRMTELNENIRLWAEFPIYIFKLKEVLVGIKKIAGIKTHELERVDYEIKSYSRFMSPAWVAAGVIILKDVTVLISRMEIAVKKLEILEYARKKTTQKVNLYEKVQIPEFTEALRKIKRYLEDVDNLEKAAQKITKQKQAAEGGTA